MTLRRASEAQAEVEVPDATGVELGCAKVNLTLHVIGRRTDGYHLLSSLVVFTDWADVVNAVSAPDGRMSLTVDGPLAGTLAETTDPQDNLVIRAAATLARVAPAPPPATRLVLSKHLPIAAGLGGGSADAAATLRLLDRQWQLHLGDARLAEIGLGLGADVPMCLCSRPLLAEGIGEQVTPLPGVPSLPIVLVHPGVAMPTREVFARLQSSNHEPMPRIPARFASLLDFVFWLRQTRNDLSDAAKAENRLAGAAVKALASDADCLLARMSGSGAAAFGIFFNAAAAERAAARLRLARPNWWITAAQTGGS